MNRVTVGKYTVRMYSTEDEATACAKALNWAWGGGDYAVKVKAGGSEGWLVWRPMQRCYADHSGIIPMDANDQIVEIW